MEKPLFVATEEQLQTLERLRILLAELGHVIVPVADRYRKHELDFVALPKDRPRCLLRVRPIPSGAIMLQPYASRAQYRSLRLALREKGRFDSPVRWSGAQLPFSHVDPEGWKRFISPEALPELNYLSL